MKRLLPIGSVIKKEEQKIMIIGRYVKNQTNDQTLWDYVGIAFPIGIADSKGLIFFLHSDITQLLFVGLQDEEEIAYSYYLSKQEL